MNLKEQLAASLSTSPQLVLPAKAHQASSPPCVDTARAILHDSPFAGSGPAGPLFSQFSRMGQSIYATSPMTPNGLGVEPSAFYPLGGVFPSLNYERSAEMWKNMDHPAFAFPGPIDPMLASVHPYGAFYGGLDPNNAARRKNATRETTSALKAWLYEHRKNPYPTKGEKIMLAIITKMTLTQVSTWFANARRRLKKESKLGYKDRDADDSDLESIGSRKDEENERKGSLSSGALDDDDEDIDIKVTSDISDISDVESDREEDVRDSNSRAEPERDTIRDESISQSTASNNIQCQSIESRLSPNSDNTASSQGSASGSGSNRPKIWSIDEIMSKSASSPKTEASSKHRVPPLGLNLSPIQNRMGAHALTLPNTGVHAQEASFSGSVTDNQSISEASIIKLSYRRHCADQVALNLAMGERESLSPKRTEAVGKTLILGKIPISIC
ncbi:hypothetical protein FSP39_007742 [Pinctada imbricata]|uniref:Homeobox domain-containing protein n=1 Tax=Pinctada imbricata TaxID=66713 RepID=A0AA88XHJ2_PINIB|nr:hypothetical protein FSP39_007742 [Pinctada imbricata]